MTTPTTAPKPEALPIGNASAPDRRLKLLASEERIKISLGTVTLMSVRVGNELELIRNDRLFLDEFETFEAYCLTQWEWSASRVRQHIAAARTARSLSLPNGALPLGMTNERQLRALNVLPAPHRMEAWTEAINSWTANAPRGRDMPARHVEQIAKRIAAGLGLTVSGDDDASDPNGHTTPEALPIGNTFGSNSTTTPPRVVASRVGLPPGVSSHAALEARVIERADRAIAELRGLLDEVGTPRSEIDAGVLDALEKVEKFRAEHSKPETSQASRT